MTIVSGFAHISLPQLLLVATMALFASIIGGLAGYGTGALMPLVLVPLVGAEPVVPIIAISAMFTNLSRAIAYLRYADRRRALIVLACAGLTTALGAYGYTRLTSAGAALVIGTMLILSVPLRRVLRRRSVRIGDTGLAAGSVGYGVLVGGTSGSGVILLSLLMATGLEGAAVIATDAMISLGTGLIKISVFGLAGAVTAQVLAFALLIGGIAIPGAFLAKAVVERMPVHSGPRRDPRRCGHHGRAGDDLGRGETARRVDDAGPIGVRARTSVLTDIGPGHKPEELTPTRALTSFRPWSRSQGGSSLLRAQTPRSQPEPSDDGSDGAPGSNQSGRVRLAAELMWRPRELTFINNSAPI
ncbi:putative membrane protein YfcA [Bradyrhizobium liaoningense]